MTAGEDQPKAIVGNLIGEVIRLLDGSGQRRSGVRFKFFLKPRLASQAVNDLVPSCLDDPGSWELGDAGLPPLIYCGCKCFLRRLFGHLKATEESNKRGDDPTPIRAINRLDCDVGFWEHA